MFLEGAIYDHLSRNKRCLAYATGRSLTRKRYLRANVSRNNGSSNCLSAFTNSIPDPDG